MSACDREGCPMQVEDETAIVGKPKIVSAQEWQRTRDELLTAEKDATRVLDTLAARRRRLPMVKFNNGYTFDTPNGMKTLLDLFDGRGQLVVYQFMDNGPDDYCPGCTAARTCTGRTTPPPAAWTASSGSTTSST